MGMFKFDKEKLEEQASMIVQKSGELMESGKIRYNIAHLEREINTFKSELGHTLYKAYKDGSSAETELKVLCGKIDEKYQEIEKLQQQLDALKNKD
jgi:predicted RNase H-like nuclease (RuvC/YqgF family)